MKFGLVPLLVGVLAFTTVSTRSQTLITFDDLSETGSGTYLQSGYHGLNWSGFLCNNAILATNLVPYWWPSITNGLTGDYHGMVSPSNVLRGGDSTIASPGSNFDFFSTYLTGFLSSNLNIEVQGFRGGNLVYDETKVVSATNPTLFAFNYLDIDLLVLTSSGGQPAFGVSDMSRYPFFTMDDFMFEFVPEPSSLLLTALAAVPLIAFLRRKRRRYGSEMWTR